MYWTPWILPYVAAVVTGSFAASLIWARRHMPSARALFVLDVCATAWAAYAGLELVSTSLEAKIFWTKMEYTALVWLPILWVIFVLQRTNRMHQFTRGMHAFIAIIPVLTLVLIAFNPSTIFYGEHIMEWRGAELMVRSPGPWYVVINVYIYTIFLGGGISLLMTMLRSQSLARIQALLLFGAVALPVVADIIYMSGVGRGPQLDISPAVFSVSALLLTIAVTRYQVLDILPAARTTILDSMTDSVLVLDDYGQLVDLNPAAETLFRTKSSDVLGWKWTELLTEEDFPIAEQLNPVLRGEQLVVSYRDGPPRYYEVRISPLWDNGIPRGSIAIVRDVTEKQLASEEREALIAELQEALANVRTLTGLIPICASCKKIRDDDGYWQQVEEYVSERSEADFTHALCPQCAATLYPGVAPRPAS